MSNIFATSWTVACRLLYFPGKNTRVGCHFLLQGIKLESPKAAGRFFTTEPPGKPFYSALGAQSLSHWTTRVVLTTPLLSWGKCGLIPPVYSRVGARPSPSQSKYSLLLVSDWLRNEHVTLIRPMRVIPGKNYSCYSLSNFQVYQVVC